MKNLIVMIYIQFITRWNVDLLIQQLNPIRQLPPPEVVPPLYEQRRDARQIPWSTPFVAKQGERDDIRLGLDGVTVLPSKLPLTTVPKVPTTFPTAVLTALLTTLPDVCCLLNNII